MNKRVAVIDLETDPFLYGRKPEPFAAGFYDGAIYQDFWGKHCVDQLAQYLERQPEPLMIYAHNGGKFDFFYLIERGLVSDPVVIINGRLVKLGLGIHELRDSFSIIPVALAQYQKEKIDYDKFEASRRERHRTEILHYLAKDCEYLYQLVAAFNERFGPRLTVGATAIRELEKLHPIRRGNAEHDELFRPFYYGGRVSAFEPGEHRGNFKLYDVNSMYPHVMKNYQHPYGPKYLSVKRPTINRRGDLGGAPGAIYFAEIEATNRGALPVRTPAGLSFDQGRGVFLTCSHEIRVALAHGLIDIHRVRRAFLPLETISFDMFVDQFSAEKIAAKKSGDRPAELFAKFMLNSAYGKFGQNPANYYDYSILEADARPAFLKKHRAEPWELAFDYGAWEIWRKAAPKPRYFDVAIAASITSAARAVLLDALQHARRPLACDTDGILAESLSLPLSDTDLGAWKIEARGNRVAIAGKKMYALWQGRRCVKMASKGADLDPEDIAQLARGEAVIWLKDAPTFKLGRPDPVFIDRVIARTA